MIQVADYDMLTVNDEAYRKVRDELANRYPDRQFVAFSDGAIVDNDADFYALHRRIQKFTNRMVVRVGDEHDDDLDILLP